MDKEYLYFSEIEFSFKKLSNDTEVARIAYLNDSCWYHNWSLVRFNSFEDTFLDLKIFLNKEGYIILSGNKINKLKIMA